MLAQAVHDPTQADAAQGDPTQADPTQADPGLERLGSDLLGVLLSKLPLRSRRALGCVSHAFCGVATPTMLTVAGPDAAWDVDAVIARLPGKLSLHLPAHSVEYDLAFAPPAIHVFGMSVPRARLLGAVLGARVLEVHLANGRRLDAHELRTAERIGFLSDGGACMLSQADIAFLLGVLVHNPHLDPTATEETLLAAQLRSTLTSQRRYRFHVHTPEERAMLAQAVHEVKQQPGGS